MSDLNESLVREAFQALADADIPALLELIDADFEWTFLDPSEEDPEPQVCYGTTELEEMLRRSSGQSARVLEELVPFGERVLVGTRLATGGEAGSSAGVSSFHVVSVRNGRIVALRACRSRDEALAIATEA
jgi:ketosteroid isomerase-like protein